MGCLFFSINADLASEFSVWLVNPSQATSSASLRPLMPRWNTASALWYRGFHALCNRLYFARIEVVHAERLPESGPVLYLGLHRNGAVDGFIYHAVLPQAEFLIAKQLRANPLGRLFFDGIEVVRKKDEGDRAGNAKALQKCLEHLRQGGQLFVFPEGTSSLGPKHLPFKSGAAQLLNEYLTRVGGGIQVVPLAIHYEFAWGFQRKVQVVVGEQIDINLPATATPLGRIKELKHRIQSALESVGVNVETEEEQAAIQRLAYVSTLGTERSYYRSLKFLEKGVPPRIENAGRQFEAAIDGRRLLRHQGVPLLPKGSVWGYLAALLLCAPFVIGAVIINFLPFSAAVIAGWKLPDDRNVVSLWRILVGVPLFVLWAAGVSVAMLLTGHWLWLAMYVLVTVLGVKLCYRVNKLVVAVGNGLLHPGLRAQAWRFHQTVQEEIPR
jgi:1-acyl-sn-glycerol-3-phosphate acyltransferase